MRRLILLVLLAAPLIARADDPEYRWLGYRCDAAGGRLSIAFLKSTGNGDILRAGSGWKTWDVDALISMKDDDHIGTLRTIKAHCTLGGIHYALQLGPAPQNMNIQGRCGAADPAAWTAVAREGKPFLPHTVLGPTCLGEARFVTEVVIAADSVEPSFTFASDEQ